MLLKRENSAISAVGILEMLYNKNGEFMYSSEPGKIQAPHQLGPQVVRSSEFRSLADELEKTISRLEEEIISLKDIFGPALRPEDTNNCRSKDEPEQPMRSNLETWAANQLNAARLCLERIQNYKERCVL